MQAGKSTKSWRDVLAYRKVKTSRATIRRYFALYRRERNIPDRCDNPECRFYAEPLLWNGVALPLILDHKEGNTWDNRPKNAPVSLPKLRRSTAHSRRQKQGTS